MKCYFHSKLLKNIGYIPHVVALIFEPSLYPMVLTSLLPYYCITSPQLVTISFLSIYVFSSFFFSYILTSLLYYLDHIIALISHIIRLYSTSFRLVFSSMWIKKFQMYKLGLEKAEGPEIKLPTFVESWKSKGIREKQTNKQISISSLTTLKPLTMWITTNCWKFLKRWEYQTM